MRHIRCLLKRWPVLLFWVVMAGIAAVIWYSGKATAHSFFDQWCCSGRDCQPAPTNGVSWTPAGWAVDTPNIHQTVPFDSEHIRYNPPGEPQFFICEYPKNTLRCLYVPEPEG